MVSVADLRIVNLDTFNKRLGLAFTFFVNITSIDLSKIVLSNGRTAVLLTGSWLQQGLKFDMMKLIHRTGIGSSSSLLLPSLPIVQG